MIDVAPAYLQTIKKILKQHAPNCEVRAFGSRFQWTAKDYSDLDLAAVGAEKLPLKQLATLKTAFEESDLPFRVDVLDWHAISPEFQKVIEQGYEVIQKAKVDTSSNDWSKRKLGDVCEINPFKRDNNWKHSIIEYIDISSVGVGYLVENPRLILTKEAPSRAQRLVQDGDTIISTVRPNRRSMLYIKSPKQNTVVSTGFAVLHPKEIDPRFLYYIVFNQEFTDHLTARADGSAYPAVLPEVISDAEIDLPSLPEQRAIAGILSALDDKIEVNRRMNATLESMARAVFLEMMKEGGNEKAIGDVVTIVGGSTPSTTNSVFWNGGDIHWATPKDLAPLQNPILLDTNSRITGLGLKEISSGLLPVGTVLLSSRAPIGYLAISQIPVAINQGFIAIKCTEEVPNYFILNWLRENMETIEGRANGTTFLEISKSNFRPMKIIVPPHEKMEAFVETVEPLYQKIVANLKESRTLGSLRDGLLPKLMRGEIRVKDAENLIVK